jgi:hypothetical protein
MKDDFTKLLSTFIQTIRFFVLIVELLNFNSKLLATLYSKNSLQKPFCPSTSLLFAWFPKTKFAFA